VLVPVPGAVEERREVEEGEVSEAGGVEVVLL